MTEERQKEVFAKNLNYYISKSGKQQKEVALELGYNPTTFNTWCMGKIIPGMGKVQKIADYFEIGKLDLIDEKLDSDAAFDAKVLNDTETLDMIKEYYELSIKDRDSIRQIIKSLNNKKAERSGF